MFVHKMNRALRICTLTRQRDHVSIRDLHARTRCDLLENRRYKQLLTQTYKFAQRHGFINDLGRTRGDKKVKLPDYTGTTKWYTLCPYNRAMQYWNELDHNHQKLETKDQFKLRTHTLTKPPKYRRGNWYGM